jgi:hypothetical protein
MRSQTIILVVLASSARTPITVRPGTSVREFRQLAGLPDDYAVSLEQSDFFLSDDEDISSVVSEGEVIFASRRPAVGGAG